jgi:hypothetical protein
MNTLVPVGYQKGVTLYNGLALQWVDAETLGKLLYPETTEPQRQLVNIYARHKRHFTEKDTLLLDVEIGHFRSDLRNQIDYADTSDSDEIRSDLHHGYRGPDTPQNGVYVTQRRRLRFFSVPSGAMKICKFSNSGYAVRVMERMLEMYAAYINGTLPQPEPTLIRIAELPKWTAGRGKLRQAPAEKEGVHPYTIQRWADRTAAGEPIRKPHDGYLWMKHRDIYAEAMRLLREGKTLRDVEEATGVDKTTLSNWRKKKRT